MDKDTYILLKGYQILLRCYLYENNSDTINKELNVDYPSYVELINGISSMLAADPAYFLLNEKAFDKAYDIIEYRKLEGLDKRWYISNLKDILGSLRNLPLDIKREVTNSYIAKELDDRFLDFRYTNWAFRNKDSDELKDMVLRLESFDYEYLKLIDDNNFMYVNDNLIRQFVSSTNYLLKYYPFTFDVSKLDQIRDVLIKYKNNRFANLALNNVDNYAFTYKMG